MEQRQNSKQIEELAKALVWSNNFDTFFGFKTRSRRLEQSNPTIVAYPTVIIEPRMGTESVPLYESRRMHIADLISEIKFSYIPCNQEPLKNGRVEILPCLDPELSDIEKVVLLVKEIEHQVWLLEQSEKMPINPS